MNYYSHHIGDYSAATAHLTWDEDMAYTRLLRAYYHHEAGIKEGQQYRLARATTPAQVKAVDVVIGEFFTLDGTVFIQKRAEEEIAAFRAKSSKASDSAKARWAHSERNANALPTHCEGNAPNNQEPITKNQTPTPTPTPKERTGTRGTRLPPNWSPSAELSDWARNERADLDMSTITASFSDYWHGTPGAKGIKLDWAATFRNWVRSARAVGSNVSTAANSGPVETMYQRAARERMEEFAPSAARKRPSYLQPLNQPTEVFDVSAKFLG